MTGVSDLGQTGADPVSAAAANTVRLLSGTTGSAQKCYPDLSVGNAPKADVTGPFPMAIRTGTMPVGESRMELPSSSR